MLTDGVIFDLDGTLWDSCRVVAESWGETLRRLDPAAVCPGPDEVRGIMGMTAPQIARTLFSQYGADAEAVCLECIHGENKYIAARGGELYPELEETLAALSARVPLFIVSNCLDGYIQCFLHSSGLGRYFRDYECEGSTGLSKAENITLLCRRHALRRPVYVGDTRSDENSARKAGCAFIHAAYGFGSCEAPDAVIHGLGELPGLLETGEGRSMSDAIAAVATGAQVAAIGVVRLSGDGVIDLADRLFRPASGKRMSQQESRRLVYGGLYDADGELLDRCLCTVSRAPHSYTGEDTAEFQCHGSPTVLRAALEACFALGARQALPGEFTKRAFLNGRLELTEAEAVADLIDAESVEAAKNAAAQLSGAIAAGTADVYALLRDISAHYHAVLDYPDEDIEDFRLASYRSQLTEAEGRLRRLLGTFERGRLMTAGIPAAIVGRPNAGKSSLLNALLGYERAIVTDVPGTTRDTIEEKLRLGSLLLRLTDTAGIRETADDVERLGVERSRQAMERAELVIAVVDGSAELDAEDLSILRAAERCPKAVLVLSKSDLEQRVETPETGLPCVTVSARTGEGLDALERVIRGLFPLPQVPAGEILTNARQAEAVGRALESLRAARAAMELGCTPDIVLTECETAMSALGELSGRSVREDVTARIFERFCVGK